MNRMNMNAWSLWGIRFKNKNLAKKKMRLMTPEGRENYLKELFKKYMSIVVDGEINCANLGDVDQIFYSDAMRAIDEEFHLDYILENSEP